MYKTTTSSPLGILTLVSDGKHLTGLFIKNQKCFLSGLKELEENNHLEVFQEVKTWLEKYFDGENPSIKEQTLMLHGTNFQKIVWNSLLDIPYGKTVTYKKLANTVAKALGKPRMSAQAIGQAVGHNPISIIIPCHRVIGINGRLTGYAGGIEKKKFLLELEQKSCDR